MRALMPVLLVALFAAWSGTLYSGASAAGAAACALALMVLAWTAGAGWDPLRLGVRGRWALAGLVAAVVASTLASEVPRAGLAGVILLPLWLWLPAAMAGSWRRSVDLWRTLVAICALGGLVALWSLADWWLTGAPRPAMPLGHHNLLAAWLAVLMPAMVLAAVRQRALWRFPAWLAVAAALAAVLLSGSLSGALALAAEGALLAAGYKPLRRWMALASAIVAGSQAPRLASIFGNLDPSATLRSTYLDAALRAAAAHPWLGQGLGSVGWTSAKYLRPRPGITPPSEVVGQLHAVPLDLLYEMGLVGLTAVAALVVLFALARWRDLRGAGPGRAGGQDPELALAGLAGLLGGAVTALGNGWLQIAALPAVLCLCVALALAGSQRPAARGRPSPEARRERRWPARLYVLLGFVAMAPLVAAQHYYDLASRAESFDPVRRSLRRAVWLDPHFPLYRARLSAYTEDAAAAALLARDAARAAGSTPALWLNAGVLEGVAEEEPAGSLRRAMALDPLAAYAPFELAFAQDSAECAARALLAEPRLAAAVAWKGREELLSQAVEAVLGWEGVDPGWREELERRVAKVNRGVAGGAAGLGAEPATALLVYAMEGPESPGLSLYGFRRLPWQAGWLRVRVRAAAAASLDLPPATRLSTSAPEAFPNDRCAP